MWVRVMNGIVNPVVARLLRSRIHWLLSGRVALLEVSARESGRPFQLPVIYRADRADLLHVTVGAPDSKLWWRNFRSPWPLRIWLRGRPCAAAGVAVERGQRVSVLIQLDLRAARATRESGHAARRHHRRRASGRSDSVRPTR
jgi:hypothetical protein